MSLYHGCFFLRFDDLLDHLNIGRLILIRRDEATECLFLLLKLIVLVDVSLNLNELLRLGWCLVSV